MKKGLIAVCCVGAALAAPVAFAATFDATGSMSGTSVVQSSFLLPNATQTCGQLGFVCFTRFQGTWNYTGSGTGLPTPMSYDGLLVVHGTPTVGHCATATMNLFLMKGASNILLSAGTASGSQACHTASDPDTYTFTMALTAVSGIGKFVGVTGNFSFTGTAVAVKAKTAGTYSFTGTSTGSLSY